MGNLSKNERLQKLQDENETLKKKLTEMGGGDPSSFLDDDETADAADPSEMTVKEIREAVAQMDDIDALDEMHNMEAAGKNRATALDAISARVEQIADESDAGDGDSGDTDEDSVAPDPNTLNVKEVRSIVAEVNDAEILNEMYKLESAGKNRKSALDAILSRVEDLPDDGYSDAADED